MKNLTLIRELVDRWTNERIFPGASLLVQQNGKVLLEYASGLRDLEKSLPVGSDNIWVVASIAKPVATVALMQILERGTISPNQRVADLIPDFHHGQVRVRHLVTHTSGLGPVEPEHETILRFGRARAIADQGLLFEPGTKCSYSTPAFDLVEQIVCEQSGLTWVEYTRKHIFEPLGMHETSYQPPPEWNDRIPVVYDSENRIDPWWNNRFLREIGLAGGGLYSSLQDLAKFGQSFLRNDHPILSKESCEQMIRLKTAGLFNLEGHPQTWGLGWYLNQDGGNGFGSLSNQAFGHGGITGTWLCVDPQHQLIVVKLANRLDVPLEDSSYMHSQLINLLSL